MRKKRTAKDVADGKKADTPFLRAVEAKDKIAAEWSFL